MTTLDHSAFNRLIQFNILKPTNPNEYGLSHDFRSLLSENVEKYKELGIIDDDGPAVVQTIKEFFNGPISKSEIFKYLNIIIPMIKSQMGGVLYKKKKINLGG